MMTVSWCNISSIENNFTYSLLFTSLDSTMVDSNFSINDLMINKKNKSPIVAMISSFIIPGSGQAYMGRWKRGLIFLGVEGLALFSKFSNEKKAKDKRDSYVLHAKQNWDLARWIHDYYAWESGNPASWHDGSDDSWHQIRAAFINTTAQTYNGDNCDDFPHCYLDIWDHSHSVNFEYKGEIINSSNEVDFKDVYRELCDINSSLNQSFQDQPRECQSDIENITDALAVNGGRLILDHHFYEGIQKYSMYFAGWEDARTDAIVSETNNNNTIIMSPKQKTYQDEWSSHNEFSIKAERASSYMLINHFISMIDVLILSRISNTKYLMNIDSYPDLKNKSGLGGIQVTLNWNLK